MGLLFTHLFLYPLFLLFPASAAELKRYLVDKVPSGCQITIVSDSCHSGGLIDESKEQIGESHRKSGDDDDDEDEDEKESGGFRNYLRRKVGLGQSKDNEEEEEVEGVKNKSLPISTLIELLKQKTGKKDIDVGKLRPTLFDVFGEDASPKVKKFMNFVFGKIKGGNGEEVQRVVELHLLRQPVRGEGEEGLGKLAGEEIVLQVEIAEGGEEVGREGAGEGVVAEAKSLQIGHVGEGFGGSSLERPIPGKWSSTTEELSGEQLTPGQAQGFHCSTHRSR
ncbi:hypothetical protein SASPL_149708 [Salvia splendens]|uniref:Legumain n=1 Tax=Salvia splendens TaxID=180675 RepID=A0A8X8WD24_SALSN|nr:hypothetical protein SASPL_149708 [Salvia splendens]